MRAGPFPSLVPAVLALALALLAVVALPGTALAYNVPGSAQRAIPEVTEIATGIVVRSIKQNMRPLRDGGGSIVVSSMGSGEGAVALGTPLAFSLGLRDLSTDDLKGRLTAGSLLVGGHLGSETLLFGGIIAESGDIRTFADTGRIRHDGMGLVIGLDHRIGPNSYLTGIVGAMSLDYDVSRGGGAVTGSFGADRQFIDLSADFLSSGAHGDLRFGLGLLYLKQSNDGYVESGGGVVAPFSFDSLSAQVELRNTWGKPGDLRPYADLMAQGRLGGSDTGAAAGSVLHSDWEARLGLGVEQAVGASWFTVGVGANFGEDDFQGFDAELKYSIRF